MTKYYCDRCGKEIAKDKRAILYVERTWRDYNEKPPMLIELCENCWEHTEYSITKAAKGRLPDVDFNV